MYSGTSPHPDGVGKGAGLPSDNGGRDPGQVREGGHVPMLLREADA